MMEHTTKKQQLAQLLAELERAAKKLPIATQATDIVFGEGDADAEILLIGEAPGFHEHVQRRPFVGRSGKLLRKVLAEVGFPPESVYITNIVKARPPDNRDPSPEEIAAYRPFLDQEIRVVAPTLIVTLGRFSMAKFLPDVKISQVHGRLHRVIWQQQPTYVLPMYHPAAALRSTQLTTSFTNDFQKLAKVLDWVKSQQATEAFNSSVMDALNFPKL